jgi:hypothetical protein
MTDSDQTPRFREAYQNLIDEIRKVPDTDLTPITIDIPTAIASVLGTLPAIRRVRPQIVTDIPTFDITRFDKLESYTLALGHAHTLYLTASAPAESIDELVTAATQKRELLLSDATALSQRGLLNGQRLAELKGPVGYRNLAFDLFMLAAVLRENLAAITGKTALQPSELDEAETLADRLITAVGVREQAPIVLADTTDIRLRAFALFLGTYDHARRAVSYLRWTHSDLDEIAPSLYSGRGNGNTRRKAEPTPPPAPASAPTSADPSAPKSASNTPTPANGHEAHDANVGFPDSQPFANH